MPDGNPTSWNVDHLLGLGDRSHLPVLYGSATATQFLDTFREFPPRPNPAAFTIDNAVEELEKFLASRGR